MSGGYGPGGYPGPGYGAPGSDDRERTRPRRQAYGGSTDPGYDQRGYDPRDNGQPVRRAPRGGRPRRAPDGGYQQGGYDQRRDAYDQGPYDQGGYDDQRDDSFLPGFDGGRGGYDDGGGRTQERDGRYGYDDGYAAGYDGRRGRAQPDRGQPDRGQASRGPGRDGDDWDARNARPRKKATRWLPRILVLSVVLAIVIGGLVGGLGVYHKYEARYHPADYTGQGTGDVTVQVETGDDAFSLAPRLLQLGVIASTRAFTNAASDSASTAGLEAGYYQLHYHMQASLAYAALLNPKNLVQTIVTIPEGKRVSQILTILAAHTKIPLSQFESAAKDTTALGLPSYAGSAAAGVKLPATVPYGKLEGYLFPATYAITPHETAVQILQAMVQRFDVEAQSVDIEAAAKSVGLTPDQLIIEASMVQAEAGVNSDMPKMERVMLNRKARGMPYGFDSVVFYGLGTYGINISPDQAKAAGVYNDTQQLGLPPTPIGNPGDAAIQAVLHPASGPWLYFLTETGGKASIFSATCLPGTCG